MKMMRLAVALFGAALLVSSGALAGENNKVTLNINQKVEVQGKTLDPGKYKVEWTGNGQNAQVVFTRGSETVATVPAHVTDNAGKNNTNAYGTTKDADGTVKLTTIYLGGQKTILNLDQNTGTSSEVAAAK